MSAKSLLERWTCFLFWNVILSFSPLLGKHPTRSLWSFSGWGGGVLYLLRFIEQPPQVLFFHPKVSHHCYKLASRERYKLTNSKQPRQYSLTAGRREPSRQGTVILLHCMTGRRKVGATSHSLLCSLGFPGPAPVLLAGLGHFSLGGLCLPVFWVESTSFIAASGVVSHTFQFSSKRAADKVSIQPAFLLTCVRTLSVTWTWTSSLPGL